MKYFIPTTILNLNNILSTDSISPVAFYKRRNFGSPHWHKIKEGPENVLLLYSKPFCFSLESEGQENRPMFISIESSDNFIQIGDGVFVCDHTIYFDWNTSFLFLSKEDMKVANSLAQISDSAKMYCLYRDKRMIHDESINNTLNDDNTIAEPTLNEDCIDKDFRLNKIKGFLYGYYVGAILTCRPQDVGALMALKQVYAKIVSMFSSYSFENKPTEELLRCEEDVKKCIIDEIEIQNQTNLTHKCLLDISKREVMINDMRLVSLNCYYVKENLDKELFTSWINNILCNKEWGRSINAVKSQLADELTKDAIRVYGVQKWESSNTRTFLNNLRHSLAGEYFHQEWDNGILSSLAALLMRGDDWKDMMAFMQSKGMYDYRLALGLFGSWTGFASLPTDFTDILLLQDKQYVKTVCDDFYYQLFGTSIPSIVKKERTLRERVMYLWESMPSDYKGKKDKDVSKNKRIIENVLCAIEPSQNIEHFLQMLSKQDGWKKGNRINYFRQHLTNNLFIE
jgi:hypothetical protein